MAGQPQDSPGLTKDKGKIIKHEQSQSSVADYRSVPSRVADN
jgi:hypothetical protein